jgi:hypothetical protein
MKRITANLPAELLEKAQAITGLSITETLTRGLELICQSEAQVIAKKIKGNVRLHVDGGRNARARRG